MNDIHEFLESAKKSEYIALDTETTGLFPFHGDRLFCITMATEDAQIYLPCPDGVCSEDIELLKNELFSDRDMTWFMHNALFDLMFLHKSGISILGHVHCTAAIERVTYNDYQSLSLEACGLRRGFSKDMTVKEYIEKHKLKKDRVYSKYWTVKNNPQYDLVPEGMIKKYAIRDAKVCYKVGISQIDRLVEAEMSQRTKGKLSFVYSNEVKLQKTLYSMKKFGVLVDEDYCLDAKDHFAQVIEDKVSEFKKLTGYDFVKSNKCFAKVFESDKSNWVYTEKGAPSFTKDVIKHFDNPAAKMVIDYANAKSSCDYFEGFLKHKDAHGVLHTDLIPYAARSGRFSSSRPNLQNMKKSSELGDGQFPVRRAIVPRAGCIFVMIDYDQMEYRLMLDMAKAYGLIEQVLGGLDVHAAMAQAANITRGQAKTVNFGILYGQGVASLARSLGVSEDRAKEIRDIVFKAAPEVEDFIYRVKQKAKMQGSVTNWFGRVCYFPDAQKVYKAPNYLIQGGCADVMKAAMNLVHKKLKATQSRMVLNIHDELVFEVHRSETGIIPEIKKIMETVYPYERLPLTCGVEWSDISLFDRRPFEDLALLEDEKARDQIQREDLPVAQASA